jgi:hypothetical protein
MAIKTIVTRGYGTFGTIGEIVVRGYLAATATATAAAIVDFPKSNPMLVHAGRMMTRG